MQQVANDSKENGIELRVEKNALAPVYLQRRGKEGSIEDRITEAVADLNARSKVANRERASLEEEFTQAWNIDKALLLASGTQLLTALCAKLGGKFNKEGGDSARLVRFLAVDKIHPDLRELLTSVSSE